MWFGFPPHCYSLLSFFSVDNESKLGMQSRFILKEKQQNCSFIYSWIRWFFFVRSHVCFSLHSLFTHSFFYSFAYPFDSSFARSFIQPFVLLFVHRIVLLFVHPFVRTFVFLFIHSLVLLFVSSSIHLFYSCILFDSLSYTQVYLDITWCHHICGIYTISPSSTLATV